VLVRSWLKSWSAACSPVQRLGQLITDDLTQVTVSSVPWYKERLLQKVSLGSLLMIVLLRTAHYNLAKLKVPCQLICPKCAFYASLHHVNGQQCHCRTASLQDVYLQTNTLAALANLAPHCTGISSHAAQRLVSLFELLARRLQRLEHAPNGAGDETPVANGARDLVFCLDVLQLAPSPLGADWDFTGMHVPAPPSTCQASLQSCSLL